MSTPRMALHKHLTIVGVGSGIGLATVKKFAREGFDVTMVSRDKDRLEEYRAIICDYGVESSVRLADASDPEALKEALLPVAWKTDVLIYNAAAVEKSSLITIDSGKFLRDLQVNVMGAFVATQAVIASMQSRGEGTVLFTGGGFAREPDPRYLSLSIGKAALWNLGIGIGKYYRQYGIHIAVVTVHGKVKQGTAFAPDLIANEFWRVYRQPVEEWEQEVHIQESSGIRSC